MPRGRTANCTLVLTAMKAMAPSVVAHGLSGLHTLSVKRFSSSGQMRVLVLQTSLI